MISIVASKSPQYDCSDAYSGSYVAFVSTRRAISFVVRRPFLSLLFFFSSFFSLPLFVSVRSPIGRQPVVIITRIIHSPTLIFIDARAPPPSSFICVILSNLLLGIADTSKSFLSASTWAYREVVRAGKAHPYPVAPPTAPPVVLNPNRGTLDTRLIMKVLQTLRCTSCRSP